jgi:hypothetical protein
VELVDVDDIKVEVVVVVVEGDAVVMHLEPLKVMMSGRAL